MALSGACISDTACFVLVQKWEVGNYHRLLAFNKDNFIARHLDLKC